MTSPSGGLSAQRIALASQATGGSKPSTAMSLAGSDLSDSEVGLVGNFIQGMGTTMVAKMARASGATTKFSDKEKAQLDALREDYSDVDESLKQNEVEPRNWLEKAFDVAGTKMANAGESLLQAADPALEGMDWLMNGVKVPARLLSTAIDGGNDDEVEDAMRARGYDPENRASEFAFMWNQGDSLFHNLDPLREQYGDETVDLALEFYSDPAAFNERMLNDPTWAAQAKQLMDAPEWADAADAIDRKHISPGRDAARLILLGHEDNAGFTALSGVLDAAYTMALDPTLVVGKGVRLARAAEAATGAITGARRFGLAQYAAKGIDVATGGKLRAGVANIRDQEGIAALFARNADGSARTQVGKGVERFLNEAAELRRLKAAGNTEEYAKLHAGMTRRFDGLMPFLDEVNGKRVIPDAKVRPHDPNPPKVGESAAVDHGFQRTDLENYRGNDVIGVGPRSEAERITTAARNDGEVVPDGTLTDANGVGWFTATGKPIESLEEFGEYLASTTGLLRLGNGFAAQTAMVMPGRVSWRTALAAKVREARVGRQLADEQQIFDHTQLGRKTLPTREEADLLDEIDALPAEELSDAAKRGEIIRNLLNKGTANGTRHAVIKRAQERMGRRTRRLSTLLPTVSHLDLNSSAHAEQVRRFGRLYLTRTEADRLAAMWTAGSQAERRQIANGMLEQTYHASGLASSDAGQAWWTKFRADQDELAKSQMYGYDDLDKITTDRGEIRAALHLSQLNDKVLLPSFREMQYLASKHNAASWMARHVGARFYSETMDSAMGAIKMGWITSPAGGLRNALDEVAGVTLRGEGADLVKYRSLYTQATKAKREKVYRDSKEWLDLVKAGGGGQIGEEHARSVLGARLKAAGTPEARRAAVLENRIKHRIPLFMRGQADRINDVVLGQAMGRYLSAAKQIKGDEFDILEELVDMQAQGLTSRVIADTFYGDDLVGITDNGGAIAAAHDGIMSSRYGFKADGWEKVEVDGGAGIDAWAGTLARMFSDPADPAHVALRNLWEHDAETAVAEVRAYLNDPRMKHFMESSEVVKAVGPDEYAERLVANVKLAVTGKGRPEWDPKLVDEVREWKGRGTRETHGKAAMDREAKQGDLDTEANDALAELTSARQELDALRDGVRTGKGASKHTDEIARLQAKVDKATARRDRLAGKPDPDDTARERAQREYDDALSEFSRHETKVSAAREKLAKLKAGERTPKEQVDQLKAEAKAKAERLKEAQTKAGENGITPRSKAARDKVVTRRAQELAEAKDKVRAAGKVRKPKPETVDAARAEVRALEVEYRRAKRVHDKAEDAHVTAQGKRSTTPEEIIASRDAVKQARAELDAAKKRLGRSNTKLEETASGRSAFGVTDEELAEAEARVKAATKRHTSAKAQSRSNQVALQRNQVTERDHEFDGHIDDHTIRKYLREEQGIEPREGEFANGQISGELAEALLAGEIPDRSFLAGLADEHLPRYAIKQQFAPILPSTKGAAIFDNWTELLAKGYKKVVTDQVQAIARNPLFASKYVTARRNVQAYEEHLLEQGWSKEAAAGVSKRIALAHAEQETIKHIDNPNVQSQFSVLARNFWAFERAQEDWLRRWGRNLRDDPAIIRKGQLAIHAGTSAGVLHEDEDGNLTFTYPGSGALIQALTKILPGDTIKVPVIPDLSSRLTFVNPSLDNPLGFSATPVISVPFKWIASSFGADYPLLTSSMDKVINGEMGAGREWYEQMLPTPIARIVNGTLREDPGSKFGQAYMQAVANLEAAGKLDDLTSRDVNGVLVVDPGKMQEFHNTLQAQIKNNMVWSALMGTFAPAAPGSPENTVAGAKSANADWSYHKLGLESLKAEWRVVSSKMPYEDAMQWWTENHPGELVYATGSTTKLGEDSQGAAAFASLAAAGWMQDNKDFLAKFPGIGTYFLPQGEEGTAGAEFSDVAYRAQIEQGIREKKDLREFLDGVVTSRGEKIYYDTKDDYDDAIARAEGMGDAATAESLRAQWASEKELLYAQNPLLAAKNAQYAESTVKHQQQLGDLVRLMNDPESYRAIGQQANGVQGLLDAYRRYQLAMDPVRSVRSDKAGRERTAIRNEYQAQVARITEAYPGLADLARGVFRIPS